MPSMYEYPLLIQVLRPVRKLETHMQISSFIKINGGLEHKNDRFGLL